MSPFPNGFNGRSIVCNGRDLTVQVRVSDEFASIRYQIPPHFPKARYHGVYS
jgi:hypothetical protein